MMRKNIVLDLDSTLISSYLETDYIIKTMNIEHPDKLKQLIETEQISLITVPNFGGSGTNTIYHVIKRPGLEQFLSFCQENFENVIVWSAGHPRYVNEIVRVLDPNEKIFSSVYTSNHTVMYVKDRQKNKIIPLKPSSSCSDFVLSSKPLKKIAEDHPYITLENTVIIDDLSCNFALDNAKNGVLIPAFKPIVEDLLFENIKKMKVIGNDLCLYRLVHYLADEAFACIEDVRRYDLRFFFKERLIGSSDDTSSTG